MNRMKLLWYLGIIWILCSNASSKTDNKSIGVTTVSPHLEDTVPSPKQ